MTETVKLGVGIEISTEALVEVLRQRFPNIVDWDALPAPQVEYGAPVEMLWLGFTRRQSRFGGPETNVKVAHPIRTVAEGAPIPTARITARNLRFDTGAARCGQFARLHSSMASVEQCRRVAGHTQDHHYIGERDVAEESTGD
jgi:hypothetical protein